LASHQPLVHDELLDVVPERHEAAQVALRAVLAEGTGAGRRELRDKALQDGELRLVLAQELHVLGGTGRGDGAEVEPVGSLQAHLDQRGQRDADRIVGAARGRGGQHVGARLALLGARGRGERAGGRGEREHPAGDACHGFSSL
jgi:hypothetical protein